MLKRFIFPEVKTLETIACREIENIDLQEQRKIRAINFKNKYANSDEPSIFTLTGLKITEYTHQFIRMNFTPSQINNVYICNHRKYHVTLEYREDYKRWTLRRNQVPCREALINIFDKNVYDDNLWDVIIQIYETLQKNTKDFIQERCRRKQVKNIYLILFYNS